MSNQSVTTADFVSAAQYFRIYFALYTSSSLHFHSFAFYILPDSE